MNKPLHESSVEKAALEWLKGLSYPYAFGSDITCDGAHPERPSYNESALAGRLRDELLPRLMSGEIRVKDAEKSVREAE